MISQDRIATYIAFGVGLGNLGPRARTRVPKLDWLVQLNAGLRSIAPGMVVRSSFGHTGNFVVTAALEPSAAAIALARVLETPAAVMSIEQLQQVVGRLDGEFRHEAGVRLTPGAAFLTEGIARPGSLTPTRRAEYRRLSDRVVLVWKRDALTDAGVLDRDRRAGGWGAIAGEVERQVGGRWTARSIRTLAGSLRVAHLTAQEA